jgi:hypothetical protein
MIADALDRRRPVLIAELDLPLLPDQVIRRCSTALSSLLGSGSTLDEN